MAYANVGTPQPTGGGLPSLLWHLFQSPTSQAPFLPMAGVLPEQVAARVNAENPNLVKWVMDRSGRIVFGNPSQYHEEMAGGRMIAGGTIENGRVNIFRDLTKAGQGAWDGIKEKIARQWVEQGREILPGAVGGMRQAYLQSLIQPQVSLSDRLRGR